MVVLAPRRSSKRRLNLSTSIAGHLFLANKVRQNEPSLSADLVHLVPAVKKKRKSVKKEMISVMEKENICNEPKVLHNSIVDDNSNRIL